jgi:hypothetical protein
MLAGPPLPLQGLRLILLLDALMTILLLLDAWAGHYRRGFVHLAQYVPFPVGALLAVCAVAAAVAPHRGPLMIGLQATGWLAVAAGLTGFCLHHIYGVATKPGGYRRLLDSLMYGAPPLAPLALSLLGAIVLVTQHVLVGAPAWWGIPLRSTLLAATVLGLLGAMLQVGILHYRGAFNQPLMYLPLITPLLASITGVWVILAPSPSAQDALLWFLWLTLLSGFLGLGMHLRGFDRQMAGLYVSLFNWLQGPPAFAPALFAGFAAIGLVAIAVR